MDNNTSFIFPIIRPLPEILGEPRLRKDVLNQLYQDTTAYSEFQKLSPQNQEAFLEFCMGNRGLKITFDPFFQHIFDPDLHPERLNMLLSAILRQKVRVKRVLPRERKRTSEDGSFIIMDILVEISDKSLINVEMQRIGYDFPSERCFCYGADLLVRQYDLIRAEKGEEFSYRDIRPVYVIVLMESSPGPFQKIPHQYIHRSDMVYDTELKMNNLLNFVYISLDIFRMMPHNELTELDAWLYFLASDNPQDILRIVGKYSLFRQLYQEIIHFRFHPKELITMYSDALQIMDRNTERYMIDELKEQISQMNAEICQKKAAISQKEAAISQKDAEISQKDAEISQKDAEISQKDAEISQKDAEISQKDAEISQKDAEISQKDAEIQRLLAKLAQHENAKE